MTILSQTPKAAIRRSNPTGNIARTATFPIFGVYVSFHALRAFEPTHT